MNPAPETAPPGGAPTSIGDARFRSAAALGATGPRILRALPLISTLLLLGLALPPMLRDQSRLAWSLAGAAGVLLVWQAVLRVIARRRGWQLAVEFVPVKSHYVQACVQLGIFMYWGWFAREVYAELPMVVAQVAFLYAFEALVTWSRGRTWRLGFGPLPIILSTNLLLWFKADWFFLQLLMVALGALGKQFVTWERDGRRTHIFNPSAFGQSLIALALIATGTTNDLTWGERIAATFDVPHMLVVIFLGGLIVQALFHVTLMTVAAAATLYLFNLAYTAATGTYFFVNISIAAPIFLGLHLLVTDPATSPRTNLGRVVFGAVYALAYCLLYRLFDDWGVPLFWDKLLPVPVLNLCVPLIDRLIRGGPLGALNRAWESALSPGRMNLVHMACWAGLFGTMVATGFIEAMHPGNSIPFWKRAVAEGKPRAAHNLIIAAGAQAVSGYPPAINELGVLCIDGTNPEVKQNPARAARYFADACAAGSYHGCLNVATQFLFLGEARTEADAARALDHLESECARGDDWVSCFLVGMAYEKGRGRPLDRRRAIDLYEKAGLSNVFAAKGVARIALSPGAPPYDLAVLEPLLSRAANAGDEEACWYLAYMYAQGKGVPRDEQQARALLARACELGAAGACEALRQPQIPPFSRPVLSVPGWWSAFPTGLERSPRGSP